MALKVQRSLLSGTVHAPPSKSYTHRALILAALSGKGRVENDLISGDTTATFDALASLGFTMRRHGDAVEASGALSTGAARVDARNSGTTLRLLTALASRGPGEVTLDGDRSLRRRPMEPLLSALESLGVSTRARDGRAPVRVKGPWRGGATRLDSTDSSQFATALLLAALGRDEETALTLTSRPLSAPYLELTRHVMEAYGVAPRQEGETFIVPAGARPARRSYVVPGDYSSAAFFMAAAAATGGRVTVAGLDRHDPQGDRAVLEALVAFGAGVQWSAGRVTVESGILHATELDLGTTPDLFPVLCAVAAVAKGRSVLRGAPQLRLKESDRIAAVAANLRAFGIACKERDDGLEVEGGRPRGAVIASFDDHRVAQAGLILGLCASGESRLEDEGVVDVSYPGLVERAAECGAAITP